MILDTDRCHPSDVFCFSVKKVGVQQDTTEQVCVGAEVLVTGLEFY